LIVTAVFSLIVTDLCPLAEIGGHVPEITGFGHL